MKWVTIVMAIMIIFMGFSLASGMVVYWIAGSIFSIAQTLIIEAINKHKKGNGKKPGKKIKVKVGEEDNDAEVLPAYMQAQTGKKQNRG